MFDYLSMKNRKLGTFIADKKPRADKNATLRKLIGPRFIECREINGWSQSESATRLGYKNSTQLSLIERGDRMPPIEVLRFAATIFGVSADYLMCLSDEPERDPKQAEKQATLRQVSGLLATNAEVIVDVMLSNFASGAPTVATTRGLVESFKKHAGSVRKFHEINEKRFDTLRGGASVIASLGELDSLVRNAEHLLYRHDHFVEKSGSIYAKKREADTRSRAERRAAAKQRLLNEMASHPDQFNLVLDDAVSSQSPAA